jgi:hypothetical protein
MEELKSGAKLVNFCGFQMRIRGNLGFSGLANGNKCNSEFNYYFLEQKDLVFSGSMVPLSVAISRRKIGRISTAIGAKGRDFDFLSSFKEGI